MDAVSAVKAGDSARYLREAIKAADPSLGDLRVVERYRGKFANTQVYAAIEHGRLPGCLGLIGVIGREKFPSLGRYLGRRMLEVVTTRTSGETIEERVRLYEQNLFKTVSLAIERSKVKMPIVCISTASKHLIHY